MTATTSGAYAHRERRQISIDHVVRSAFGIGFLAVALYEAGAPLFSYTPSDAQGYAAAGIGLVVGGLLGLWK